MHALGQSAVRSGAQRRAAARGSARRRGVPTRRSSALVCSNGCRRLPPPARARLCSVACFAARRARALRLIASARARSASRASALQTARRVAAPLARLPPAWGCARREWTPPAPGALSGSGRGARLRWRRALASAAFGSRGIPVEPLLRHLTRRAPIGPPPRSATRLAPHGRAADAGYRRRTLNASVWSGACASQTLARISWLPRALSQSQAALRSVFDPHSRAVAAQHARCASEQPTARCALGGRFRASLAPALTHVPTRRRPPPAAPTSATPSLSPWFSPRSAPATATV